jgi:hypothetical protein
MPSGPLAKLGAIEDAAHSVEAAAAQIARRNRDLEPAAVRDLEANAVVEPDREEMAPGAAATLRALPAGAPAVGGPDVAEQAVLEQCGASVQGLL